MHTSPDIDLYVDHTSGTKSSRPQWDLSQRADHLLGVNQFFTDLTAYAHAHPDCALARWLGEARARTYCRHNARPDGLGVWREHAREITFCLEHDTGTESLSQLTAKLDGYGQLAMLGQEPIVLFWLHSPRRETNLRKLLRHRRGTVPKVATANRHTAAEHGLGSADALWRRPHHDDNRPPQRLADLAPTPPPWR